MTNIQYMAFCLDCDKQVTDYEAEHDLHKCKGAA